jgi:hypothetical protein
MLETEVSEIWETRETRETRELLTTAEASGDGQKVKHARSTLWARGHLLAQDRDGVDAFGS